ncbi:MAG: flagellar motor protein MotB [Bryobacteraceae bacterium]
MPRRKRSHHNQNHERWLISYADFITLLFAFFVVMFATAQSDRVSIADVSKAVKQAFEEDKVSATANRLALLFEGPEPSQYRGAGISPVNLGNESEGLPASLASSFKMLREHLRNEIADGMLTVSMEARGLVVSLRQAAFFPSGQDVIDGATYPTIGKIAAAMRNVPNKIRLEGHTDSDPIRNNRFHSNWELSAARSVAMLNILAEHHGIPAERMSIAGYADTAPLAPNDNPEAKARNRRVDIVFLNESGMLEEPKNRL